MSKITELVRTKEEWVDFALQIAHVTDDKLAEKIKANCFSIAESPEEYEKLMSEYAEYFAELAEEFAMYRKDEPEKADE